MYKLRGKIKDHNTEDIETAKGQFKKMTFIIEEKDTGFEHDYQFEIFGAEAIALHEDKIEIDKLLTVHFYIKSREYNGRYYNTLMVKSLMEDTNDTMDNIPFAD
jgi:hypothetical protein